MISIITPTFNSSNTITKNIQSVIAQSFKEFEHIIVDNASTDDTITKIESLYKEFGLFEKLKIISKKYKVFLMLLTKVFKLQKAKLLPF